MTKFPNCDTFWNSHYSLQIGPSELFLRVDYKNQYCEIHNQKNNPIRNIRNRRAKWHLLAKYRFYSYS